MKGGKERVYRSNGKGIEKDEMEKGEEGRGGNTGGEVKFEEVKELGRRQY